MTKLTTAIISLLFTGIVSAAGNQNIYQCIDKKTFEQDPTCIANMIANNNQLQIEISSLNQQASDLDNDKVLSLMKMNPADLSIEVTALSNEKAATDIKL